MSATALNRIAYFVASTTGRPTREGGSAQLPPKRLKTYRLAVGEHRFKVWPP